MSQNITVSDSIKTNTVWEADTVFVDTCIVIADDVSLAIDPGVVVAFDSAACLKVNGTLIAAGTEDNHIIFTSVDTTGYGNLDHDGWSGIYFDNTGGSMTDNQASIIDYSEFYYSRNTMYEQGVVSVLDFSNLTVSNSLFKYNYAYTCINLADSSEVKIINNVFDGNTTTVGAISLGCSTDGQQATPLIKNNLVMNNTGEWCAGIKISGYFTPVVDGNKIFANDCSDGDAGGLMVSGYSNPVIVNNVIAYNHAENGGGVFVKYFTNPVFVNNVIAYNTADENGGGIANGCFTDSVLYINNIIYGNTAVNGNQMYINDDDCSLYKFYYNDIEGGLDDVYFEDDNTVEFGTGNIDEDPMFVDAVNFDFSLDCNSGCIDAGKDTTDYMPEFDILGNNRNEGITDMGAYEMQCNSFVDKYVSDNVISVSPNPSSGYLIISNAGGFDLKITDLTGKTVLKDKIVRDIYEINIENNKSGIYFLHFSDGNNEYSKKLILK